MEKEEPDESIDDDFFNDSMILEELKE